MAIDKMMSKKATQFENIELDVTLKNIIIEEEEGIVKLVFYSDETKSTYSRKYPINDKAGRIDFNRVMFAIGAKKNNYSGWLNILMKESIEFKISVSGTGYVKFIKVLEKEKKERIAKTILIESIEGSENFTTEEREFLISLPLSTLRMEFGS